MIIMYSKPSCPFCDGAERWFAQYNIPYTKVDVSEDTESLDFLKSENHRTVPQFYLGGKLLVAGGFDGLQNLGLNGLLDAIEDYERSLETSKQHELDV